MPRQRSHAERRAMFHNMGTGARVKLVKKFGINDVPVGSEGIIVEHFGKDRNQPIVAFHGYGRKVMKPDLIQVIKPSNKFESIRHDEIKVYGTMNELKKKLLTDTHRFADGGGEWVKGFQYIDNGMGDYFDYYYRIKVKNNGIEIHAKKSDLPKRWQHMYDEIKEDIIEQVEEDIGVKR